MKERTSLVLLLAAVLTPSVARADALPPPTPISCPAGSHVSHGHGGTRCVVDAPKDCPVGWVGVEGGRCLLQFCMNEASCGPSKTCREVDLCSYQGMRSSTEVQRSSLFAAPPQAPSPARIYFDVCGPARTCKAPAKCRTGKVCLPANVDKPAPRPSNGGETWQHGTFPDSASSDGDEVEPEAPATTTAPPDTVAPATTEAPGVAKPDARPGKSGGCAGCAVGTTRASDRIGGALAVIGLALAVARVRRRRR